MREAREETGYQCNLFPVTMPTRAPPATETGHTPDIPRVFQAITEPFMITVRECSGSRNVKFISWYITAIDEHHSGRAGAGEERFHAELFGYREVLEKLTFQLDRDIVRSALDIISTTLVEAGNRARLNNQAESLLLLACAGDSRLLENESFLCYGSTQSALVKSSDQDIK